MAPDRSKEPSSRSSAPQAGPAEDDTISATESTTAAGPPLQGGLTSAPRRLPISALPPDSSSAERLASDPARTADDGGYDSEQRTVDLRAPQTGLALPAGSAPAEGPEAGGALGLADEVAEPTRVDDPPRGVAPPAPDLRTGPVAAQQFDDAHTIIHTRSLPPLDYPASRSSEGPRLRPRSSPRVERGRAGRSSKVVRPWGGLTVAHALLAFSILVFLLSAGVLVSRVIDQTRLPRQSAVTAQRASGAPSARASTRIAVQGSRTDARTAVQADARSELVVTVVDAVAAEVADAGADVDPQKAAGDAAVSEGGGPADGGPDAAPVAAGQGAVLALSSRPRALAYLNGRPLGRTPVRVDVAPDQQLGVVLVAAGRRLYRRTVSARPGRTVKLRVRLKRASYRRYRGRRRGILRVRCLAGDDRRILLDGRDSGLSCPSANFVLRPGRHKIGFEGIVGGEVKSVRLRIRPRAARRLRLTRK